MTQDDTASRTDELKRALLAIRDLRRQVQQLEARAQEPIAIVGMACRLPGGAATPERYWDLLRNGEDGTIDMPTDRWDVDALYDPDPEAAGRMYTRRGGFLREPVDRFDAAFFGISPREAGAMDPVQRLLLELSWEALERAGIPPLSLDGTDTGVFVGVSGSDYNTLQQTGSLEDIHTYRGTGTAACVAGGRISFVLGLHGPNVAVDTACSSSLVAVTLAVESLRAGKCRLALAGGAHLMLAPESTVYLCRMRALSPDGRCRTFAADADGYARGEGGGMLALKRLSDAQADGDRILAVIRGAATNHDGRSSGLTVPNPNAQRAVIESALKDAGLAPHEVDYVEAHGTATPLGDPIEVRAMSDVLGRGRAPDQPLLIGSVKTNFGHLEAAAGVAGLMKLVLSIQHGELPPHLHCDTPTPHVDWSRLPVRVNRELRAWNSPATPTAGVSAFGFSGTNAHVIVQAAPATDAPAAVTHPAELVVLSGRSPEAVRASAASYAAHVRSTGDDAFGDVALTSLVARSPLPYRASVAAASAEEMTLALEAFAGGEGAVNQAKGAPAKLAFLFTGQGAQYPGMGRELMEASPVTRTALERCAEILRPHLDRDLLDLLVREQDDAVLQQTQYAQPALFALEYALASFWIELGIRPAVVAGHSLGEYVAATVAGVMTLEEALPLVALRGRLMQALPAGGAMAAVLAAEARVRAALADGVSIAGSNGPENTVISGPADAVQATVARLEREGVQAKALRVSHAFHSALMEPMLDEFERAVAQLELRPPRIPLVSNLTGDVLTAEDAVSPARWRRHIREPVRFDASLRRMHELGARTFLEVGPHPALSAMGAGVFRDEALQWLPSMRRGRSAWLQVLDTLGQLWCGGHSIDAGAFERQHGGRRTDAPTYPFQRERHWFTDGAQTTRRRPAAADSVHDLLGAPLRTPVFAGWIFEPALDSAAAAYLADHVIGGHILVPGAASLELMLAAAVHGPGWEACVVRELAFERPFLLDPDAPAPCQVIVYPPLDGCARVRVVVAPDGSSWQTVASGVLQEVEPEPPPIEPLAAPEAAHAHELSIPGVYASLEARGIHYGRAFRTLAEARLDGNSGIGRVRLPAGIRSDGYRLHPCVLDGALHMIADLISRDQHPTDRYLPSGIDAVRVYAPVGDHCIARISAQLEGTAGATSVVADVRLLDDHGNVLAAVDGFRARRVRAALPPSTGDLEYTVEWEDVTDALPAPTAGPWLLLGPEAATAHVSSVLASAGVQCLAGRSVAALHTVLSAHPDVRGVVYLHALDADGRADDADSALATALAVCEPLPALVDELERSGLRLRILTAGSARRAIGGESWMAGAALWGATPSIRAEHPELEPRLVDLDPVHTASPAALAAALFAETAEDRLILRGERIYAPRLAHLAAEPRTVTPADIRAENYRLLPERRGTLDAIRYEVAERVPPGPGEVEVRVRMSGLNFRDVLNVLGGYPGEPGPPGVECAGMVERVGAGVTHVAPGDAVMGLGTGLFCGFATLRAHEVVRIPPNLSFEEAATLPVAFLSAEWGLARAAGLRPGERVLIHAAAGGVGQAAVQIARAAGAEIFATAGSEAKRALLRSQGIEHVFDSRSTAFADGVRAATGGEGVHVVLNSLTGELLRASLDLLAPGGRFVELGVAELLDPAAVAQSHPGVSYHAFQLGALPLSNDEFRAWFEQLTARFERGELRPLPLRCYAPDRVVDAFRFMAQARHTGKIVIGSAQVERPISGTAAYLVTGASGAIARHVVEWLVTQGAGALILMARSAPDAAGEAWLETQRARGTSVVWHRGDVAEPAAVNAALEAAARTGLPLRGVFHTAGVLDDGLLRAHDRHRFERVLAPKVAGSVNLHAATAALELDHFVLFSSSAALMAGPGQVAYGAANAFMGALAEHRRERGQAALCIDWGAWAGGGMAARLSERERSALERTGLEFLEPDRALAALDRLMFGGPARVLVAEMHWDRLRTATVGRPLPLLRRLLEAPASTAVAAAPAPDRGRRLTDLPEEERAAHAQSCVLAAFAAVLGLPPGRVEMETPIAGLGFDSLMAMELRNRVEAELGVLVPVAALLHAEVPAEIVAEVCRRGAVDAAGRTAPQEGWTEIEI